MLALLAFLGVASFNTLVNCGLHTTTAVNAVLMQPAMSLVILMGSWLVFGEPLRRSALLAIAISLAGVAVIVTRGSLRTLRELSLASGDGWIMLAVLLYAFYSVLLRRRSAVHSLSFVAATFALGSLMLLPLYLGEHFQVRSLRLDGATLAALAYVCVFPCSPTSASIARSS